MITTSSVETISNIYRRFTFSNLGGRWVKTFFLWFVDIITWKSCFYDQISNSTILIDNKCENKDAKAECLNSGGRCQIDIDGYYIEVAINVIYGIIWYQWGKKTLDYLQNLQKKEWHVLSNASDQNADNNEAAPLEDLIRKA